MKKKSELKENIEFGCVFTWWLGVVPALLVGLFSRSGVAALVVLISVFLGFTFLVALGKTRCGAKALLIFLLCLGFPGFCLSWLIPGLRAWQGLLGAAGLSVLVAIVIETGHFPEGHWGHHGWRHGWRENPLHCLGIGLLLSLIPNGMIGGWLVGIFLFPSSTLVLFGFTFTQTLWAGGVIAGSLGAFAGIYLTPIIAEFLFDGG